MESNNIFIGARSLNENQVRLIVPTYDNIIEQIEEMRREARSVSANNNNLTRKQYNNTIGLFGARGTGKTSTIFTILNKIDKNKNDIVLPIIEPDTYGDNTKITGVILGAFKEKIKELCEEIKKSENKSDFSDFFNECNFKKNNELENSYNNLLEYYCYKESEYRQIITKNYNDMETYKKKYSYLLAPDYEFNKKFKDFIDIILRCKKNINKEDKEPMIIIVIDDVDLKTQKCKEVIDGLVTFTCHPNIICFLSGDYEILEKSITLALLDSENVINSSIAREINNHLGIIETKKDLTNEYLKKILPPAFRHNVVKWNLTNIPNFSFEVKENEITLISSLCEVFGEDCIFKTNKRVNNELTFMLKDIELYDFFKDIPNLKIPYSIFDNTPRGLVNVFYYLNKYKKSFNEEKKFQFTKGLIDTIINSSTYLNKKKERIYKKYLIWGTNEKNTDINFDFSDLIDELDKLENNNKEKSSNKVLDESNYVKTSNKILKKILVYFIFLYICKILLPKSNFVEKQYKISKNCFIHIYRFYGDLKGASLKDLSIDKDKLEILKNIIKLDNYKKTYEDISELNNNYINEILYNSDLKFALEFLENMPVEFKNENFYKYSYKIMKNRELYLLLINLIANYGGDDLVKKWYLNREKFNNIIDFLNDNANTPVKHEIIKYGLFNISLENYIQENNKVDNIFIEELFLNSIEYSEKNKSRDNNSKIIRTIKKLNNLKKEENGTKEKLEIYLKEELKNSLEKEFKEYYNKYNNIKLLKIIPKNIKFFLNKYNNFIEGVDGENTKYSKLKKYVESTLKENCQNNEMLEFTIYKNILEELKNLFNNNRVWYGVKESKDLYNAMKRYFYLEVNQDLLRDINAIIEYKIKFDKDVSKLDNINKINSIMLKFLDKQYDMAFDEEKILYSDIVNDLSDLQDGTSNN